MPIRHHQARGGGLSLSPADSSSPALVVSRRFLLFRTFLQYSELTNQLVGMSRQILRFSPSNVLRVAFR